MCLPCPLCLKRVMQDKKDIPRVSSPTPTRAQESSAVPQVWKNQALKLHMPCPQLLPALSLPSPCLSLVRLFSPIIPTFLSICFILSISQVTPPPGSSPSPPLEPHLPHFPLKTPQHVHPTTSPPPVDAGPTASQIFSPRFRLKLLRDQDPSSPILLDPSALSIFTGSLVNIS